MRIADVFKQLSEWFIHIGLGFERYTQINVVNPDKNPFYKQLLRKNPSSLKNFYDKEVKSFIYELEGN